MSAKEKKKLNGKKWRVLIRRDPIKASVFQSQFMRRSLGRDSLRRSFSLWFLHFFWWVWCCWNVLPVRPTLGEKWRYFSENVSEILWIYPPFPSDREEPIESVWEGEAQLWRLSNHLSVTFKRTDLICSPARGFLLVRVVTSAAGHCGGVSHSASHNSCQTQSGVFMHSRLLISLFWRSRRVQRLRSAVLIDFGFILSAAPLRTSTPPSKHLTAWISLKILSKCSVSPSPPKRQLLFGFHTQVRQIPKKKAVETPAGMLNVVKVFPCLSNPDKISSRLHVVIASSQHDLLTLIKVRVFLTSLVPVFIHSSLNSTVNRHRFDPFSVSCLCPPLHFPSAVFLTQKVSICWHASVLTPSLRSHTLISLRPPSSTPPPTPGALQALQDRWPFKASTADFLPFPFVPLPSRAECGPIRARLHLCSDAFPSSGWFTVRRHLLAFFFSQEKCVCF